MFCMSISIGVGEGSGCCRCCGKCGNDDGVSSEWKEASIRFAICIAAWQDFGP